MKKLPNFIKENVRRNLKAHLEFILSDEVLRYWPIELTNSFYDIYIKDGSHLITNEIIDRDLLIVLKEIDEIYKSMSDEQLEKLYTSEEWMKIKEISKRALLSMKKNI